VQILVSVAVGIVRAKFKRQSCEGNGRRDFVFSPWLTPFVAAPPPKLYLYAQATLPAMQAMQIQKAVDTYPMQ